MLGAARGDARRGAAPPGEPPRRAGPASPRRAARRACRWPAARGAQPALSLRIAIGIATRGRAAVLARDAGRDRPPAPARRTASSSATSRPEDVAGVAAAPGVEFLTAPRRPAAAAQRDPRRRRADCDVVLFLDDDFLPAPDYLAVTEARVRRAAGRGGDRRHGDRRWRQGAGLYGGGGPRAARRRPPRRPTRSPARRTSTAMAATWRCGWRRVRAHGLRFDEALPLYAWYEDIDFTRRLGRHGAILRLAGARGVHLGVKSGRVPGRRLGYSQVANPIYLARKGSFPWSHALPSALRHLAMNAARAAWPEPHVDRAGRLARQPARGVGPAARPRLAGAGCWSCDATSSSCCPSCCGWCCAPAPSRCCSRSSAWRLVWRGRRWGRWPILAGLGFYLAAAGAAAARLGADAAGGPLPAPRRAAGAGGRHRRAGRRGGAGPDGGARHPGAERRRRADDGAGRADAPLPGGAARLHRRPGRAAARRR